ncbi:hypothetical protein Q2K19_14550 [Micromonospora soli]|nr:hypothetical protein [Micromonospora sp. NBRC 110009]WKU01598.1 hypothetical protein Q2K19_14550 [Micromonospora sp. NBRC 110009]
MSGRRLGLLLGSLLLLAGVLVGAGTLTPDVQLTDVIWAAGILQ